MAGGGLALNCRVRDWRGATQGAVRSGAQHRSESGAPQSPTPAVPEGKGGTPKKIVFFLSFTLYSTNTILKHEH